MKKLLSILLMLILTTGTRCSCAPIRIPTATAWAI